MNKILCIVCLLLLSCGCVLGQNNYLNWSYSVTQKNDSNYSITLKTAIPTGAYIYHVNSSVEELAGIEVSNLRQQVNNKLLPNLLSKPTQVYDSLFSKPNILVFKDSVKLLVDVKAEPNLPTALLQVNCNLNYRGEFLQPEQKLSIALKQTNQSSNQSALKIQSIQLSNPMYNCVTNQTQVSQHDGLIKTFLLGLLGGFIALFTPCVFPMIPVTVSFFTKKSGSRKSAIKNGTLYGFFILAIYLLASIPFHVLGNVQPEIFNNISTNAWLNIVFFIIFIFFAFAFFGFYEITLPSSVAGKTDEKSGLSSLGGIFFMALTLAIVSFSCTGPIMGTLLVGSLTGGAWQLTAGMAGFGVALGLPFALFAIFPHWLHSLPKSGSWLDTVKKVLAFVELALALKFLSNADLVMHWGIIKREIFFGIWILIALTLSAYLFGWLKLPHDYSGQKISLTRKLIGVCSLAFALYLVPGVTNTKWANLQALSGFPPPLHYSVYSGHTAKNKGLEANYINNYQDALQASKQTGKPILLDFTGWACVNCRKMEENVWTNPDVKAYIQEHFVLVSLYVDDRKPLPAELQQLNYKTDQGITKDILTQGDFWATFQSENFKQTTQPLYCIVNAEQKLLNTPVGYTPNAAEYLQWLKCGNNNK